MTDTGRLPRAQTRDRLYALRRMKGISGGLLVLAAAVFVVCVTVGDGHGGWGYLQAAAEASMVGGLADWFAVTALFRHPLGVPIPHTAIIPRKKDQLGASLGAFVQQNFLSSSVVGERLAAADIPGRLGEWLADPAHAQRVADEAGSAIGGLASMLRDDELRATVAGYADKRLREVDLSEPLARIIDAICDSGRHQIALTIGLRGFMRFLDENKAVFRRRLAEESPEWVPSWVDDRLFARLFSGLQSFLADVSSNDQHELRARFDERLRAYAHALRTDPQTMAAVDAAKLQLLEHPKVRAWLSQLWGRIKSVVLEEAADPSSGLRRAVESLTVQLGTTLRDDDTLRARADRWLQRVLTHLLARYADDLAGLISGTIARWDARETGRRIELQVGRDLQFIRINGTVVGALVGLIIYAVSQLL